MHTMMCEACPEYEKQSSIPEKGISKDLNRHDHDIKLNTLIMMMNLKNEESN